MATVISSYHEYQALVVRAVAMTGWDPSLTQVSTSKLKKSNNFVNLFKTGSITFEDGIEKMFKNKGLVSRRQFREAFQSDQEQYYN